MKKIIPVLAALALVSSACTKEIHENQATVQENDTLMSKLAGGSEGEIIPGTLLVKLDAETAETITNGGWSEVSEDLFGDMAVKAFCPAIPAQPKNAEVAKKYGLDRWFCVNFDEKIKPHTVALRLAASPTVRTIQYSRPMIPIMPEQVFPIDEMPQTRAGGEKLFNDQYSNHQWNLYNDGSIAKDAKAGADVGVKDAWRLTGGDPSVVVAILDCGLAPRHEDIAEAMWKNEDEIAGNGKDDDGNGYIDDVYGFNFTKCSSINTEFANNLIEGRPNQAVKGDALDATTGTGHGMHVAGIIGATNGNGVGISSIAGGTGNGDGVRLMSCQIYRNLNPASDAQRAAAFIYAADNGACIAQCSYGDVSDITDDQTYIQKNPLEYAAMRYFLDKDNSNHESLEGNIIVFSAGNESKPYSMYPGAFSDIISVTAFGYDFLPGGYTHYGPGCKIAAPGGEFQGVEDDYKSMILSLGVEVSNQQLQSPGVITDKGGKSKNYVYMQGTSMACPHVSGVIALGISYAKKLNRIFTREELTSLLLTSVDDLDQHLVSGTKKFFNKQLTYENIPLNRWHNQMGTGAVNAWKFLMAIEGTPSVIVKKGSKTYINLSEYCNASDSYDISIDDAAKASLGIENEPVIKNGKLEITCTKVGAGKVKLSATVGEDPDNDNGIGSMPYSREISIVSREFATQNGGWL